MKGIGTLLMAMMIFTAVATADELPKGPPSKNKMNAPCQKCSGVVVKVQTSSSP